MSDYVGPEILRDAFRQAMEQQLGSIAIAGVMPSAHGALSKLLCSCYSKHAEPLDAYHVNEHRKMVDEMSESEKDEEMALMVVDEHEKSLEEQKEKEDCQMMLSTISNYPYGSNSNGSASNSNNHRMIIEDVTDDPNYSSYGNENDEPPQEGAFIEYEKLDRTADPASSQIRHSTIAFNKMLADVKPVYQMTVNNGTSAPRVIRIDANNLKDVEDGARCREKECRFGWKQHPWRKVCVHCKSDRADHELAPNQALNVYQRLGIQPPADMPHSTAAPEQEIPGAVGHGYAWVPPGLSRKKVEEYMAQLPNNVVPRTNSIGEKVREKQLLIQLPRQDLSVAYCRHLQTSTERKVYEEFVNARNEIALDIGYVCPTVAKPMECHKCSGILDTSEMAVIAPKLGDTTGWHPACFTCQTCEQLLVDLTYCVKDGHIYCERHYAELHKPRCSACDELIFAGEYTKAMNKDWHSDHFCCWQCDQTLTGQRYIMRDEQPYCIKCYEDVFANQCDECAKPIGIDSKDLSYKDKHWHEHCFLCSMCKISLVDMPFGSKNDRIFCSNCYDQAFATRCDGCNEIFRAGMKKMEYKGKQWHDKCFCCAHCKVPIGTKSFIPKNEDVYCGPCYEEKFATRCSKCKKVITAGGVTYKNEPWHRECFCCTNCNSSLAGQRFTSKDDKPYCANCYGELFAKRCNACTKPITGIGGAKFISFEDRHWHNDCFICAQCTTSLVGKGFITDGHEILCPECAKARLMAANS